jgi:hypothetical protein
MGHQQSEVVPEEHTFLNQERCYIPAMFGPVDQTFCHPGPTNNILGKQSEAVRGALNECVSISHRRIAARILQCFLLFT